MKTVSILALAMAVAGGAVHAQTLDQFKPANQALAQPAAETPPLPVPVDKPYPGMIELHADASDIDRHVIYLHEIIPVDHAGPMVVLQPQWIPGTHSPEGDTTKIAGIHISANGQDIPWQRDNVHIHALHFDVPTGAKSVTVDFQFLSPVQPRDGVVVHTRNTMDIEWWYNSLYPGGYYTRQIPVKVILTLPQGWGYGSALETDHRDGDVVTFKPISYDNLIDSPLIAGRYFKSYDLAPGDKTPVHMDVVADYPDDLDIPDNVIQIHRNVVQEAYKLFGAHHYDHYDFLVAVSDEMGGIGLEHHRSSEDAVEPNYFKSVAGKGFGRDILPHEYTHSWDGKFRRPAGQFQPDFEAPMRDDLMWVYEGGTQYWGEVIESRSGLYTFDQRLQSLANMAAQYDTVPGRQWRDLQDTTYDPILSDRQPKSWPSWQRSEDYYSEGELIWLEADTLIREKTHDKKSLDDFAKAFAGMDNGSYLPLTYTFDDIVKTLNSVYPYDWASFLKARLTKVGGGAPLEWITRGGYKLVYTDTPSAASNAGAARRGVSFAYSLGLSVMADGTVASVTWGGLAFKAGLTASKKIVAVNGRAFDASRLQDIVVADAKPGNSDKIDLLIQDGDYYRTVSLDYHGGPRYPKLVRVDGTPDYLKEIFEGDHAKDEAKK